MSLTTRAVRALSIALFLFTFMVGSAAAQTTYDMAGPVTSGSLASGSFTIGDLAFQITSDTGFSAYFSSGRLHIEETGTAGNITVVITETGGGTFTANTMKFSNYSVDEPTWGAPIAISGASGIGSYSIDKYTGTGSTPQNIDFDWAGGAGPGLNITFADGEPAGVETRARFWIDDLNLTGVDGGAPANNPPAFTASGPFSVLEGATGGTTVGNVNANDGDGGGTDAGLTYSITAGNTGNAFAINGSTGVITVNTASAINYEGATSFSLTVQADDGEAANNTATASVTVNVTDAAPSTPTDSNGAANTVAENAVNGTTVGVTASATDPNGGTITYSLTDNAGGRFAINSSTGVVTVAGGIDYETATSYNITVQAADPASGGVKTSSQTFAIAVTNVNEAPVWSTFIPGDAVTILEDATLTLSIAGFPNTYITVTDVDAGAADVLDMSVTGSAGSTVTLAAGSGATLTNNGTATVTATGTKSQLATALDGMTFKPAQDQTSAASITFDIDDNGFTGSGGAQTAQKLITVNITAVNDVPSFTKGADETVNEDAGAQTVAAWATALSKGPADEAGQTLSFNVANDNNPLFAVQPAIDGATGNLTYTPAANASGSAVVTVSVSDDGGTANGGVDTSANQTFNITVAAQNDAPVIAGAANTSTTEDTGVTFSGGTLISVSDTEATNVEVTVTSNATMSLGTTNNINITAGATDTHTVTFDGTIANVNTALDGLRYSPGPDQVSAGSLTIVVSDLGATGAGGPLTDTANISIAITPVNDAPSFTKGADESVNEDAGARTVNGWATALSKGPADEAGQTLTFNVSNNNNPLFAVQPAIDGTTGNLTYTPAANASGSAVVTVSVSDDGGTALGGVDTSANQTFNITVNAVNDAPTLASVPPDRSFTEDTAGDLDLSASTFSDLDAGANDIGLKLTASAGTMAASDAGGVVITGSGTGEITLTGTAAEIDTYLDTAANIQYAPAANANGNDAATVTLTGNDAGFVGAGGGTDVALGTVNIDITAVNDVPSFTKGADESVNEDAGLQTVAGWATALSKGPANEAGQTLTFNVANDNNPLFAVQPAIDGATGNLTYTPAANANGSAVVTVSVSDDGGGADTSADQTFNITVNAVNDTPSFTKGADETILEDAGAQTVAAWATAISKGPADEAGQTLTFTVSNDNNALFSVQPAIASNGTLTYTSAANAHGSAVVTVSLSDNGSGANTSADQTFNINVTSVNDVPSFTKGADQTQDEDPGVQTIIGWATAISKGPANESGQTLTFNVSNDNNALFSVQPEVDGATGTMTYTPASNANGSAVVTVSLSDDGGGADTSADQTFTITINAVNDAPSVRVPLGPLVTLEDTPVTFTGPTAITVSDVDLGAGVLDVVLTATSTVDLGAPGGVVINAGADGTNTVSFSGTEAQVNAALDGLVYTPSLNQIAGATLTLAVSDGGNTGSGGTLTTTEVITFNITSVNDTPEANPDFVTTNEDTAIVINVLANDSDPDGDDLTVTITAAPTSGTAVVNPDGTITYTPNANVGGVVDRFDYAATDGDGAKDTERIEVTITAVNDVPVVQDDAGVTPEDTAITIDVLANDSDVESTLAVSAVGAATNGSVVINGDNSVTYTPTSGFHGSDSFTYTAFDGTAGVNGTVTITVTDTNSPPVAVNDVASVFQGQSVVINVLANDSDADGDAMTVTAVGTPASGTVVNNNDGTVTYTAGASTLGVVTFSYTISDPSAATASGSVSVTVSGPGIDGDGVDDNIEDGAPNDGDGNGDGTKDRDQKNVASLPISGGPNTGQYLTVVSGAAFDLIDVTSTANPSPGDFPAGAEVPVGFLDFQLTGLTPGQQTAVTIYLPPGATATGYMKYGPTPDDPTPHWYDFAFDGETGAMIFSDRILLFLKDGKRGDSDLTENGVVVDPGSPVFGLNMAPVAAADAASVEEDGSVDIDVLVNDSDADGDALTPTVIEQPVNGTVEVMDDGSLRYTPAANFIGQDTITYQVIDTSGAASEAIVTVTVTSVQDAPEAGDDEGETPEDTAVLINIFGNDVDPDGDVFYLTSQDLPQNGSSVYNEDGTVTYTPNPDFVGVDTWVYTISDGPDGSNATVFGRITVTVIGSQDAPVGVADSFSVNEDDVASFTVLANDTDADGDALELVSVSGAVNGSVGIDESKTKMLYAPNPDYFGTETLTYTMTDGVTVSDPVTVTVTVTAVNDAPYFGSAGVLDTPASEPVMLEAGVTGFHTAFRAASDTEDDAIAYEWQLSTSATFADILYTVGVSYDAPNASGKIEFAEAPDTLIAVLGLAPGGEVAVYQRMVATDEPGAVTPSAPQEISFGRATSVANELLGEVPVEVYLRGNYPNPFNPSTTIEFGLPEAGSVRLEVYDMQGRLARVLVNRAMEPGNHRVLVSMDGLASGVYVYRLVAGGQALTRTLQLVK